MGDLFKRATLFFLISANLFIAESSVLYANEAMDKTSETVGGVVDVASTISQDAKMKVEISLNLTPDFLNESVDNAKAEAKIDDSAHHFELAVLFESDKSDFLGLGKSTHSYFAIHKLKFVSTGEDWADSTSSIAFLYGHKYYSKKEYQGFGYGWYAGLSSWSTSNAYFWNSSGGPAFVDETESGISVLVAGELFYKYEIKNFFTAPRVILGFDKDYGDLLIAPQLMIGGTF